MLQQIGTGARRLLAILQLRGTLEIASVTGAILLQEVGVKGKRELVAWIAHAICAIYTIFGFRGDAIADTFAETAYSAEILTEILIIDRGLGDAREGIDHALAELLVGDRWKGGARLPCTAGGGTFPELEVLDFVIIHADALGVNTTNLLLEIVVVNTGFDVVAVDIDQTCGCFVTLDLLEFLDKETNGIHGMFKAYRSCFPPGNTCTRYLH